MFDGAVRGIDMTLETVLKKHKQVKDELPTIDIAIILPYVSNNTGVQNITFLF